MNKFIIFALGFVSGAAVAWYVLNKHGDDNNPENDISENDNDHTEPVPYERSSMDDYIHKLDETGYRNYSSKKEDGKPYIITPEEFGDKDDYDMISLTYYIDGTLADDNDEPVEDIESEISMESLNHFGEYEDDSIFVRNDELKVDYEVILDQRNYADVIQAKPYLAEGK